MKKFIINYLGAILGFIFLFFYLTIATDLIDYPLNLAVFMLLMLGPLAIFGMVAIANFLNRERKHQLAALGKIFGICAFSIWVCVMCIQQGSRIYFKEYLMTDPDSDKYEIYRMVLEGVNSVQFTMDIAFDVFYCLVVIFFSIVMLRDKYFGKLIGIYGLASGIGLLFLNLYTFPYPPAESGLIDLGPWTGVFWVVVIIMMIRGEKKERSLVLNSEP
jgi:hypothetical protein